MTLTKRKGLAIAEVDLAYLGEVLAERRGVMRERGRGPASPDPVAARDYPDGLKGMQIPTMARIIAVADTFSARRLAVPGKDA